MAFRALTVLALSAVTLLSGCAAFRNYDTEMQQTNEQLSCRQCRCRAEPAGKEQPREDKDLLYYFEKGELLRAKGDLPGARTPGAVPIR